MAKRIPVGFILFSKGEKILRIEFTQRKPIKYRLIPLVEDLPENIESWFTEVESPGFISNSFLDEDRKRNFDLEEVLCGADASLDSMRDANEFSDLELTYEKIRD